MTAPSQNWDLAACLTRRLSLRRSDLSELAAQLKHSLGLGGEEYGYGARVQLLPAHETRPVYPEEARPFESLDDINSGIKVLLRRSPAPGPACAQLLDGARIEAEGASTAVLQEKEAKWQQSSEAKDRALSALQAELDATKRCVASWPLQRHGPAGADCC